MPIRLHPWIGAVGMGAAAAWLQKRQNEQGKSIFGGVLESLGIPSDAVGLSLLVAATEALDPVYQMIPAEYRAGHSGAVDAGLGIAAMYFAAKQGLGAIPQTGRRVRTSAPVSASVPAPSILTLPSKPALPVRSPGFGMGGGGRGTSLADSLTVSGW